MLIKTSSLIKRDGINTLCFMRRDDNDCSGDAERGRVWVERGERGKTALCNMMRDD